MQKYFFEDDFLHFKTFLEIPSNFQMIYFFFYEWMGKLICILLSQILQTFLCRSDLIKYFLQEKKVEKMPIIEYKFGV